MASTAAAGEGEVRRAVTEGEGDGRDDMEEAKKGAEVREDRKVRHADSKGTRCTTT